MLCGNCETSFNYGTRCGHCRKHYCFSCSKINDVEYENLKPYLRAAWKCPFCREEMELPPSYSELTSVTREGAMKMKTDADASMQEVMHKLNEISTKLECLPKLIADVDSIRKEISEVKRSCELFNARASKLSSNISISQDSGSRQGQHREHKKNSCAPSTHKESSGLPKDLNDPFAFAPKSTFDLSDFKRYFSREDEHKSILYFWEKFDPENYSIWYSEYKSPHLLTKVYMSCNLITGMFQRLDKMRKHAFASACVFGDDNDSSISGVWVWRGHELIFPLSPDWQDDYELYSWRKLELVSKDTLRLVHEYFSLAAVDSRGRRVRHGRIYK